MIRFSREKVKLLHQLMAEATGGSVGVSVSFEGRKSCEAWILADLESRFCGWE